MSLPVYSILFVRFCHIYTIGKIVMPLFENRQLFFLHLRKTGGTSLRSILYHNFHPDTVFQQYILSEFVKLSPDDISQLQFISGHLPHAVIPYLNQNALLVTMLREPTDRVVSFYYYVKHKPDEYLHQIANENSLLEFVQYPRVVDEIQNEMARYIGAEFDIYKSSNYQIPAEIDIDLACRRLEAYDFVGVSDRFQDSLNLLTYTLDMRPQQSVRVQNQTPSRRSVDELSLEELEAIEEIILLDRQLYQYASNLFEERYNAMMQNLIEENYIWNYKVHQPRANRTVIYFADRIDGAGWHPPQNYGENIKFRFMGPQKSAHIDVRIPIERAMKLEIQVLDTHDPVVDTLKIRVNDIDLPMNRKHDNQFYVFYKRIPITMLKENPNFTRIEFLVDEVVERQTKQAGVGVYSMEIYPA